jgi:hypothetical protein
MSQKFLEYLENFKKHSWVLVGRTYTHLYAKK